MYVISAAIDPRYMFYTIHAIVYEWYKELYGQITIGYFLQDVPGVEFYWMEIRL
jgi:hypothetical protein